MLLFSCGLKKRPIPPSNTSLPAITDRYKVTIERDDSLIKKVQDDDEDNKKNNKSKKE